MLSQRILHALFTYDPKTGYLYWIKDLGRSKKYKGRLDYKAKGYLRACIFGETYQIEKLVWQYHNGYYPEKILDHLNGIPDDNRIENLREASVGENARNSSLAKNNSSGIRGIYFNKKDNAWFVTIRCNKKSYYLGSSKDFIEAVYLRYTAEKCFDWDSFSHNSTAHQYIKVYEKNVSSQLPQ
ncbi:HNH endonuclease [bacterium]|nr:HNH endonuclease [bacterium]